MWLGCQILLGPDQRVLVACMPGSRHWNRTVGRCCGPGSPEPLWVSAGDHVYSELVQKHPQGAGLGRLALETHQWLSVGTRGAWLSLSTGHEEDDSLGKAGAQHGHHREETWLPQPCVLSGRFPRAWDWR